MRCEWHEGRERERARESESESERERDTQSEREREEGGLFRCGVRPAMIRGHTAWLISPLQNWVPGKKK